jgi:hypothetical protein
VHHSPGPWRVGHVGLRTEAQPDVQIHAYTVKDKSGNVIAWVRDSYNLETDQNMRVISAVPELERVILRLMEYISIHAPTPIANELKEWLDWEDLKDIHEKATGLPWDDENKEAA